MNQNDEMRELAIKYIHNELDVEEKNKVFKLILAEPEFKHFLKEEMDLMKSMQALKFELDQSVKAKIYNEIKMKAMQKTFNANNIKEFMFDWMVEMMMPRMALPIIHNLKRS